MHRLSLSLFQSSRRDSQLYQASTVLVKFRPSKDEQWNTVQSSGLKTQEVRRFQRNEITWKKKNKKKKGKYGIIGLPGFSGSNYSGWERKKKVLRNGPPTLEIIKDVELRGSPCALFLADV